MVLKVEKTLQFHIIPVLLSLVICFFSFSCPVFASTGSSLDCVSTVVDYWDLGVDLFQRNVLDYFHRFDLFLNVCSGADSNGQHDFALQNIDGTHSQMVCQYCGLTAAEVYGSASDDYTDSLDSTTASAYQIYGATDFSFGSSSYITTKYMYGSSYYSWSNLLNDSVSNLLYCLYYLGINSKVMILSVHKSYLAGFYWNSSGYLCYAYFKNPYSSANSGYLGVYDLSDLSMFNSYPLLTSDDFYIFYSENYCTSWSSFSKYATCYIDWFDSSYFSAYKSFAGDSAFTSHAVIDITSTCSHSFSTSSSMAWYYGLPDYLSWSSAYRILSSPDNDDSSTRMSSFASAINTYNTTNNYTDDSEVVNYYISPVLIDSGLDVNLDVSFGSLLDLDIYDEDTLIFTEPVTEMQYQTTGWTYDYTTRTYTLDLDSGTFYIGDYDIDTIDLTYGDDELTITYYSDDTAIATDEFAYLMVSQSECSLNGHTYVLDEDGSVAAGCGTTGYYLYTCSVCGAQTTETIDATGEHSYEYSIYQDPTCTAEGTGLYTCSVCGNQYTEPIAATGHSYEYSIYQEPSCTATGIGIYTCSECGDQYTETIDPTGHTAEIVEYVATEYDENGTATTVGYTVYECSVCGTQWTETDEIDVQSEGWFATISSLFKTLISALVNGLADGLNYLIENVIVSITDFVIQIVQWLFNLIDFDYLTSWFSWFDDNEVLDEEFGTSGDSYNVWNYS